MRYSSFYTFLMRFLIGLYTSSSFLLSVGLVSLFTLPRSFGVVFALCGWRNQIAQPFHHFIAAPTMASATAPMGFCTRGVS